MASAIHAATIEIHGHNRKNPWLQPQDFMVATVVTTTNHFNSHCDSIHVVWSRPRDDLRPNTSFSPFSTYSREAYEREHGLGFKESPYGWKHPRKHVFGREVVFLKRNKKKMEG